MSAHSPWFVLGMVLLCVLAAVLVLALLLLFLPIRYAFHGRVPQEEATEELSAEILKNVSSLRLDARWGLGALRAQAALPPGAKDMTTDVRVLGFPVSLDRWTSRKEEKEKPGKKKEAKNAPFSFANAKAAFRNARQYFGYYYRLFTSESMEETREAIWGALCKVLPAVAPKRLIIAGRVGLGDPARTADLLRYLAMAYPFFGESLQIEPYWGEEEEAFRRGALIDITAEAEGRVRLATLLWTGWKLYRNKGIRRVLYLLKKGPKRQRLREKSYAEGAGRNRRSSKDPGTASRVAGAGQEG